MASDPTRVPPQSLESERALLGALLLKPDAIHDVADSIKPDSFYAEKHRLIFAAMRELADRGEPIDQLSLSERLKNQGLLERTGGRSYLAELAAAAPAPGNYAHYADLVAQKSVMRALIDAYDDDPDFHEWADRVPGSAVEKLIAHMVRKGKWNDPVWLREYVQESLDKECAA